MLSRLLPAGPLSVLAFVLLAASPLLGFLCLLPFAVLKVLVPLPGWTRFWGRWVVAGAQVWCRFNRLVIGAFYPRNWRVQIPGNLDPGKSYLLICNHQSWIDIVLVADLCLGRMPFPRFFLKRELLWVPVIGLGCWALDMPFMHRHSRETIRRNPGLKGQDLATTRKSCERFRHIPVTVVNFAEGTRFTPAKRDAFGSPYRHLLRPKSAGLRVALDAMGEQFDGVLDVTIGYRPSRYGIVWSFLRGEQDDLALHAELLPVPAELLARSDEDSPEYRAKFQSWVNARWALKDERIGRMLADGPGRAPGDAGLAARSVRDDV